MGHTLQVYIGESFLIDTGGCTAGDQLGLSSRIGKMTLFVSNVHYAATTVSHWDKGSRLLPTLATLTAWSYRLILDHSDTAQFQIKIRSWFFLNLANYGGLFLTLSHIELTHLKSYWVIQPKLSWVILTLIGMRGDTFISLSFSDQILSANFYSRWH